VRPFLWESKAVDLLVRVVIITTGLVELGSFWTVFGPYALGRKDRQGTVPCGRLVISRAADRSG
jgi:hypothetical protein